MLIASIILYLIGWVACYFVCRKIMWKSYETQKWKAMDRLITIVISLLSWLAIFIFLISLALFENDKFDPDKDVTW